MKGVNKCVVEIVEPQDESIERVLVFFKPESRAVQLGCQQDAAEKYVSGLVSWRRSILPLGPARAPRCGQRLPRPPLCCCGSFCKRAVVSLRRKCPKSGGNYSKDAVSVL